MATQTPPAQDVEERLRRIEERINAAGASLYPGAAPLLVRWAPGITFVSIIAFAFWLGALTNTASQNSAKLDRVYGIVIESRDSLSSRTSVIEAELGAIDQRLDAVNHRLDAIDKKVTEVDRKITDLVALQQPHRQPRR